MTSTWFVSHVLSLAQGLAAAFASVAVFYLAGLLLLPRRWSGVLRWHDCVVLGLTCYVLLCWIATSSRNVPLSYVMLVFAGALWGLMALRFRWLQATLGSSLQDGGARRWATDFGLLYVFVYALVLPPAGASVLAVPAQGGFELVTYARYAKHLLAFGTANVELAAFEYLRTPASTYLLAWHALPFIGSSLDAAMPALFMLSALFGMIAAEFSRRVFGLSRRGSIVIAGIAVCAPMFRWMLATYSFGELLASASMMYLVCAIGTAAVARRAHGPLAAGVAAGCVLLYFSGKELVESPLTLASGIAEVVRQFSPLAVFGLPGRPAAGNEMPGLLRSSILVILPFVAVFWASAAYALQHVAALNRITVSPLDRQLARALVAYIAAAVIVGNVAVQATLSPAPARWPGGWRQLGQMSRMPFQALTLKVSDEPNGMSTALALYFLPGRKADVIGRGIASDRLPFDGVSRQQPMFIQGFGCEGVGHDDVVSAPGVGCLLMAPPSMTVGTRYPFNRTFLFMQLDRMTAREPGGRWNANSTVSLRLRSDPQRVQLDRELYVNLLVNPFLEAGVKPLRLALRWGNGRRGEMELLEQQWLSLPVGSSDWSGNRLWTVPVAIDVPDDRRILFQELALSESPRGAVVQPSPSNP